MKIIFFSNTQDHIKHSQYICDAESIHGILLYGCKVIGVLSPIRLSIKIVIPPPPTFGVKGVGSVAHGKNNIDKYTFHQKGPLN